MTTANTPMVNIEGWKRKLQSEGFRRFFIWQDGPNAFYPDHTHPVRTAHVIVEGEMTVISDGKTRTLKPGERFDVPPNIIHSARMGPKGCRYLVGEE